MEASSRCVAPLVSIMPWDSPCSYGTHHVGWVLHLRWTLVIWPGKCGTLASMLMEKILVFGIFLWLPLKPRSHKNRAAGWKAFWRCSGCWNYKQVMLTGEERQRGKHTKIGWKAVSLFWCKGDVFVLSEHRTTAQTALWLLSLFSINRVRSLVNMVIAGNGHLVNLDCVKVRLSIVSTLLYAGRSACTPRMYILVLLLNLTPRYICSIAGTTLCLWQILIKFIFIMSYSYLQ